MHSTSTSTTSLLDTVTLRFRVWLARVTFGVICFFQAMRSDPPEYTKFLPQRRFTIQSTSSPRKNQYSCLRAQKFRQSKTISSAPQLSWYGPTIDQCSGFMLDSMHGTDADFCRMISDQTGAIVLDCGYAKGPEYPFPAAPNDVKDAIEYALANTEGYFDTSRITISGFSAGGALAITANASLPKGTLKGALLILGVTFVLKPAPIIAIIAIYPSVDLSLKYAIEHPPVMSEGNVNSFPSSFTEMARDSYIPPGTDMKDPRLSPVNVPISLLPEHILLVVCEEDSLRDDAVEYGRRLKAEGVKVIVKEMKRIVHYWDKWAKIGEDSLTGIAKREAYQASIDMLNLVFKSY
ncbi:unnamed protein product [Rhizoctonia solani]|uniref:Alpha/beta hydrolase fold-3 domain-containing protein n=1 Tax=Rhizoctonia solani TaxID=456999 RepID=A0A8H3DBM1_9AGAM|nr:unnamed protein product [Rhizoctonia solani]